MPLKLMVMPKRYVFNVISEKIKILPSSDFFPTSLRNTILSLRSIATEMFLGVEDCNMLVVRKQQIQRNGDSWPVSLGTNAAETRAQLDS